MSQGLENDNQDRKIDIQTTHTEVKCQWHPQQRVYHLTSTADERSQNHTRDHLLPLLEEGNQQETLWTVDEQNQGRLSMNIIRSDVGKHFDFHIAIVHEQHFCIPMSLFQNWIIKENVKNCFSHLKKASHVFLPLYVPAWLNEAPCSKIDFD